MQEKNVRGSRQGGPFAFCGDRRAPIATTTLASGRRQRRKRARGGDRAASLGGGISQQEIGAKILEVLGAITPEADSAIIEHGADLRAGVVEP